MYMARVFLAIFAVGGAIEFAGCGGGGTKANDVLASIRVTPASQTATSGTTTNKVQFTATGSFAPLIWLGCNNPIGCLIPGSTDYTQVLSNATWATADSLNTTVDSSGLAVCLSPTAGAVKITASAPGYDSAGSPATIHGSANLTCN